MVSGPVNPPGSWSAAAAPSFGAKPETDARRHTREANKSRGGLVGRLVGRAKRMLGR